MTNTIKEYRVRYRTSACIGNDIVLADCKKDRVAAYQWVKTRQKNYEYDTNIYIEEREFTSKENQKKGLALYSRVIWSNTFHGFDMLRNIMLPRTQNDFSIRTERTTNNGSAWFITYRGETIAAFGTATYKPNDAALMQNAQLTIQQCLTRPTPDQERRMETIDARFYNNS